MELWHGRRYLALAGLVETSTLPPSFAGVVIAMATVMRQPTFTSESLRAFEELEQQVRARVFNLLEDKMRAELREVITDEDVREAFGAPVRN